MQNPKELQQEWITALRSGEYKQTTGQLHARDGFCCLGVLCELLVSKGLVQRPEGGIHDEFEYTFDAGDGEDPYTMDTELCSGVARLAGLDEQQQTTLMHMNDGRHVAGQPFIKQHTFPEIADFIEHEIVKA